MTIKKALPNSLVWGCILVLYLSTMQLTRAVTTTATPTSTASILPKLNSTSPSQNTSTPSLVTAPSSGADSTKSTSFSQPSEPTAAPPSNQTTANPTTTTLTNNGSATVPQISPSPTVKTSNSSTAYSTSTTLIKGDTTSRVISTSSTLSPSKLVEVPSTTSSKISSSLSPISTAASATNVTKSTAVPTTSSLKPSSTVTSASTSVVKPSATSGTLQVNSTTSTMNVISSLPSSTVVPMITSSAVTVSPPVSPSSKPPTPSTTAPGPTASAAPNTTVATSSASTTESTPTSTNVTVVTTTSVSPPSMKQMVYINEVLVDKNGSIQQIELKLSSDVNMTKFAMMMIDGANNQYTTRINLKDYTKQTNNHTIISFNLTGPSMTSQGVGIAVYDTDLVLGGLNGTAGKEGLVDALVLGKTYEDTSKTLLQVLTPGAFPFIINPRLFGQDKSISRCSSDTVRDSSMFALINPSMGFYNIKQCQERLVFNKTFSLKLHADCGLLNNPNGTLDSGKVALFMRYLRKEVNRKCQCGITKMHIADPQVMECCGALNLNMKFLAPNKEQEDKFQTSYLAFVQQTSQVEFDSNNYTIDSTCSSYCCGVPGPPSASKNNQVKVTVGVVVTCLIVFLIIVTILVMYMRRKKSAVYQFRMSRLTEDEDDYLQGPNCDDFVGGQDATFDLKR